MYIISFKVFSNNDMYVYKYVLKRAKTFSEEYFILFFSFFQGDFVFPFNKLLKHNNIYTVW